MDAKAITIDSRPIYKLIRKVFQRSMEHPADQRQQPLAQTTPPIQPPLHYIPLLPNFIWLPHHLLPMPPNNTPQQPIIECQNIDQEQPPEQENPPHRVTCLEKKRGGFLTNQAKAQLSEAFRGLTDLHQPRQKHSTSLKRISQKMDINYSKILFQFKHYKQIAFIAEGRTPSIKLAEPERNNYLLRMLISLSLQEGVRFGYVCNLCVFLMKKYGIEYDLRMVEKQLRKMKVCLSEQHPSSPLFNPFAECAARHLLRELVTMNRTIIYFGKYHFQCQGRHFMIMVIASKFGIVAEAEVDFDGCPLYLMKLMTLEYASRFDHKQLWYWVVSYENVFKGSQSRALMKLQESSFCSEFAPANPRILLLDPASDTLNCAELVYRRIVLELFQTKMDVSLAIEGIPLWLKNEETKLCRKIGRAEQRLLKIK